MHVTEGVLLSVQIDRTSLQVLYPLVELLHHHRLNISQPDSLPATFAPLLLPEVSAQPSMWDNTAAREALTDIVITNYRTIFAGVLPSTLLCLQSAAARYQIQEVLQKLVGLQYGIWEGAAAHAMAIDYLATV